MDPEEQKFNDELEDGEYHFDELAKHLVHMGANSVAVDRVYEGKMIRISAVVYCQVTEPKHLPSSTTPRKP